MQTQCKLNERFNPEQFWKKCKSGTIAECWLWQGHIGWGGYGVEFLADGSNERAHRIAYMLTTNMYLKRGDCVRHRCTNRDCINPHHLYKSSRSGQSIHGSQHGRSKLNEDEARMIRALHSQGETVVSLAARHGVSPSTISRLVLFRTWRHI